jgi:miniconductance mechanosensitive channel
MVHRTFPCMVRHLEPLPHGQPLEVYCFTTTTEMAAYETVQADIFDHALAVAGEFGLRIYQAPSSDDVRSLRGIFKMPDAPDVGQLPKSSRHTGV